MTARPKRDRPAARWRLCLRHDLHSEGIHAMHASMQKIQILFPDPLMDVLRKLARIEDRPVSEIVRRAVDRDIEQRAGLLKRQGESKFPTFDGGKVLVSAAKMKSVIHGDES